MSRPPLKPASKPRLQLTLLECEAQLIRVRDASAAPDVSATDVAKLAHEVRSLLKLRAHLEERAPHTRDSICDSPAWKELAAEIADAIADCNKCSARLETVLTRSKI